MLVVIKLLVWAGAFINMLAEALTIRVAIEELTNQIVGVDIVTDDLNIIVAAAVLIALEFAISVLGAFTGAPARLLRGATIAVLT